MRRTGILEWIGYGVEDGAVILENRYTCDRRARSEGVAVRLEADVDGPATQDERINLVSNVFGKLQEGRIGLVH